MCYRTIGVRIHKARKEHKERCMDPSCNKPIHKGQKYVYEVIHDVDFNQIHVLKIHLDCFRFHQKWDGKHLLDKHKIPYYAVDKTFFKLIDYDLLDKHYDDKTISKGQECDKCNQDKPGDTIWFERSHIEYPEGPWYCASCGMQNIYEQEEFYNDFAMEVGGE